MLHAFHLDVAKVDRDVAHVVMVILVCCNCMFQMFYLFFQTYVASVFVWMLHMFHIYVARVLSECSVFKCLFMSFQVFCMCFRCMFQVFHMFQRYVASVSYGCCKSGSGCCIWCNGCTRVLQASVPNVSSIFFKRMLQVFLFRCSICFTHML